MSGVSVADVPGGASVTSKDDRVGGAGGDGDRRFSSLTDCVSDKTLKAISEMGFTEMMEIQYRSIKPLLEGK